jgi:hypothetical protein
VGKARSLPYSVAPQRFFNRVASCFANRHLTRLERLAVDEHSSLLPKFVNYREKKFYNIGPGYCCKKVRNILDKIWYTIKFESVSASAANI